MRTPNLNGLRMFEAAARHLNFRLAAEELNLTQGAVAQQVRKLEADLGRILFLRKARGLAITDAGNDYHARIRLALAAIDDATKDLREQSRKVTLSVPPSFASKWLVPRLHKFTVANPEIDLQTVASERLSNFKSDGIDLAIRQGAAPTESGVTAQLLSPLNLCALCSPEYARNIEEVTDVKDFQSQRLIQDGHNQWDTLFDAAGISSPKQILQFNQTALAMDAAANGQGVALAPRLLAINDLAQGRLVEIWCDQQTVEAGFYMVHPASTEQSEVMVTIMQWIMQEAGN